jgi:hypothetical protein
MCVVQYLQQSSWGRRFCRQYREITVFSREGTDIKEGRNYETAKSFPDGARPEHFTPSTVILKSDGYGVWEITVSNEIRDHLVDATLRIETVRTHGMLHSPQQGRSASVYVNDAVVDKIVLVKPHVHGNEYGVDSRRPYPIFGYVDTTRDVQAVRIEVTDDVFWDIDRVSIEASVERTELRPNVQMVLGAIISAVFGVIGALLLRLI